MGKKHHEFRDSEGGSSNVCFFVTFPSDGRKWVVKFPIGPVLHGPWRKVQIEIATIRLVEFSETGLARC